MGGPGILQSPSDSSNFNTVANGERRLVMSHRGKAQFTNIMIVPQELVAEAERIFESHAQWMEETHHRDGDKALLRYNVARAPKPSDPMDPESGSTGNTMYIMMEVYQTEEGIADHFAQADESWDDFGAANELMAKCRVVGAPSAEIIHSLW